MERHQKPKNSARLSNRVKAEGELANLCGGLHRASKVAGRRGGDLWFFLHTLSTHNTGPKALPLLWVWGIRVLDMTTLTLQKLIHTRIHLIPTLLFL